MQNTLLLFVHFVLFSVACSFEMTLLSSRSKSKHLIFPNSHYVLASLKQFDTFYIHYFLKPFDICLNYAKCELDFDHALCDAT